MLKLTNSLLAKKELFKPIIPGKVGMYVCGITPYDRTHVGHGRCYVSFDLLYRVLCMLGYDVTYVRNFTDIDDKLIAKALEQCNDASQYTAVANRFIALYHQNMRMLNCKSPQIEPRVTEHIPLIIRFIEKLIKAGYAYESQGDVYFKVRSFAPYGKLSKHDVNDLCAGVRIEVTSKKRDPLDFALWKGEEEGTFWNSPWGAGRPGWHIECSAMSDHYLNGTIDIHGGGLDLMFPHHENEIAQSEALSKRPMATFWVHSGLINSGKEKMSKSLGNIFALEDLIKRYDPMVIRYFFLMHHYRSPLEFSFDGLDIAAKNYTRLVNLFETAQDVHLSYDALVADPIVAQMVEFLCDDLNVPGMLGVLFENFSILQYNTESAANVRWLLINVLGLTLESIPTATLTITPHVQQLLDARELARIAKDWNRADALRDELHALGFSVQDKKLPNQ